METAIRIPLATAVLGLAGLAVAQAQAVFEVVSVKPYMDGSDNSGTLFLPGGRFTGTNVTVRKLIRNSLGVEDFQMSGAPGWIDSAAYNIEAKTAGGVEVTRDNIQQLLLSLLADRFQFRFHKETKDLPEYSLEVMKGGAKVKPHADDSGPSMITNNRAGKIRFRATKISMAGFATSLARQVGRTVVDKTDLKGDFDFDLEWSPDQGGDAPGPSIFTALQDLGLRLASTKGPVVAIVIDRIERPSEN